jgi:threonyl-tRNA synthetase
MYNSKLWETSGHWQNYKDDMFLLDVEKEKWALKPMNCPGHCLIFDSRDRSYRELPIRMAEFGIIHRNEASGALTGLTRVRRFVQDDTHVFCMPSQLEGEISALFDFMEHVYGLFGFEFRLELSTRPDNYLGTIETWNAAEEVSNISFLLLLFPGRVLNRSVTPFPLMVATQKSVGEASPR